MDQNQSRSAIGGSSTLGAGNINYGVMPEQLIKQLQNDKNAEFIVISKTHQSNPAQVWSTGDPEQTKTLFRESYEQLATTKEPVTT